MTTNGADTTTRDIEGVLASIDDVLGNSSNRIREQLLAMEVHRVGGRS